MSGTYEERKKREAVAERADAERSATKKANQAYATELRRVTVGQGQGKPGDTYYGGRRRKTKSKRSRTKRSTKSRTKRSTKSKRTRSRK